MLIVSITKFSLLIGTRHFKNNINQSTPFWSIDDTEKTPPVVSVPLTFHLCPRIALRPNNALHMFLIFSLRQGSSILPSKQRTVSK